MSATRATLVAYVLAALCGGVGFACGVKWSGEHVITLHAPCYMDRFSGKDLTDILKPKRARREA